MKRTTKIILIVGIVLVLIIGVIAHAVRRPVVASHPVNPQTQVTNPVAAPVTAPITSTTTPDTGSSVIILTYHSFGPKPAKPETKMQLHYRVTSESFESQLKYLSENGYTTITFNQLANHYLNNTPIPAKSIVLTFDDGWKTQYEYAVPLLEKYHMTGTFFIITKTIGGPYMTWDEIKDLDKNGFEVASHSETHPMLPKVSATQLHAEIWNSKATLETELGHPITTFAYPYYMYNSAVESEIKSAGYIAARAGWSKLANSADTIFALKSQEVVNNPNPFSIKRLP